MACLSLHIDKLVFEWPENEINIFAPNKKLIKTVKLLYNSVLQNCTNISSWYNVSITSKWFIFWKFHNIKINYRQIQTVRWYTLTFQYFNLWQITVVWIKLK